MTLIIIWLVFIALEVYRNWYIIVKRKKSPDYPMAVLFRIVVSLVLWFAAPWIDRDLESDQWWAFPVFQAFTFWSLFDLFLNRARKEPFWYLGNGSWLDRWQKSTFGAWPWFWFKFFLAGAATTLFVYGWGAVLSFS